MDPGLNERFEVVVARVKAYQPNADLALLRECFEFAAAAHAGQVRKSGDPYVIHPLSVAGIIAELKLDVASLCAGLLHDCVEDTAVTLDQITARFGDKIAFLVDGVTKLGKIPWNSRE